MAFSDDWLSFLTPGRVIFLLSAWSFGYAVIAIALFSVNSLPPQQPGSSQSSQLSLVAAWQEVAALRTNFWVRLFAPETLQSIKWVEVRLVQGVTAIGGPWRST